MENSLNPYLIKNTRIYSLVKEITSRFYPSYKDKLEKRWEDFYLPSKRSGRGVGSHPFEIVFSWHRHGIYLYPPSSYNNWRYGLG